MRHLSTKSGPGKEFQLIFSVFRFQGRLVPSRISSSRKWRRDRAKFFRASPPPTVFFHCILQLKPLRAFAERYHLGARKLPRAASNRKFTFQEHQPQRLSPEHRNKTTASSGSTASSAVKSSRLPLETGVAVLAPLFLAFAVVEETLSSCVQYLWECVGLFRAEQKRKGSAQF